jgi:hypothetical protein
MSRNHDQGAVRRREAFNFEGCYWSSFWRAVSDRVFPWRVDRQNLLTFL